jgi:hypothetical protein
LLIEEAQEFFEHDDLLMPIIKLKKPRKKRDFDLSGFLVVLDSKTKFQIKMSSIKGLFWNSYGFGDIAKHLFVKEQLREEILDFIALRPGDLIFQYPF